MKTFTEKEVAIILDELWQQTVNFPYSTVCKHFVACNILSKMEEIGIETPNDIVKAVVECNDEIALDYRRFND